MPTVYRAARDKIAGLKKNKGLSVAAWQPLNACIVMPQATSDTEKGNYVVTYQPEQMFLHGVFWRSVHGSHHRSDAPD
jgi:hypothetical protein